MTVYPMISLWILVLIDVATSFADPSLGVFSDLGLKAPLLSFSHQERFLGPG